MARQSVSWCDSYGEGSDRHPSPKKLQRTCTEGITLYLCPKCRKVFDEQRNERIILKQRSKEQSDKSNLTALGIAYKQAISTSSSIVVPSLIPALAPTSIPEDIVL